MKKGIYVGISHGRSASTHTGKRRSTLADMWDRRCSRWRRNFCVNIAEENYWNDNTSPFQFGKYWKILCKLFFDLLELPPTHLIFC
nr:MAG TPA: hypothetical protein [Bacteriophage sp.]